MAINKSYLIGYQEKQKVASAFASVGTKLPYELISEIKGNEVPFEFTIKKITVKNNKAIVTNDLSDIKDIWLDYQPNSLVWPLMSPKLKAIIENNLTVQDSIKWIKAKIYAKNEEKIYYIPMFTKELNVIDEKKTMYIPKTKQIIKPCFSLSKIKNYSIFHKPSIFWQITPNIYINEKIKKTIKKNKLTGINFEKICIS